MHDSTDNRSGELDSEYLRLRANVGARNEFIFRTKSGLTSPNSFRREELLLLETIHGTSSDRLLVVEANYGVNGVVMASFGLQVCMAETSARAANCCRENANLNGVTANVSVQSTCELEGEFDVAAFAPRAYTPTIVVQQWIADILGTLEPGGQLYLAGRPRSGLRRYTRTLEELCEQVTRISERGDCAVVAGTRPSRFEPPSFSSTSTMQVTIAGESLSLVTYPGLFSATALDEGTRLLAEHLSVTDGERVLDLGCGYGPLGVYAARVADTTVVMTDDDYVATSCARQSAGKSQVEQRTEVITADGVNGVDGRTFDRVLCNPPTHAGGSVLHDLMHGASEVLSETGELALVHHQGVDFGQYLTPYFSHMDRRERGEYQVVTAKV